LFISSILNCADWAGQLERVKEVLGLDSGDNAKMQQRAGVAAGMASIPEGWSGSNVNMASAQDVSVNVATDGELLLKIPFRSIGLMVYRDKIVCPLMFVPFIGGNGDRGEHGL
jgi:hypothetical protein